MQKIESQTCISQRYSHVVI